MKQVSVEAFKEVVAAENSNSSVDFINVCTPAEYKEKHIEGVRNVPLSDLAAHAHEFRDKKTVYVHCRSGNRSRQAIAELEKLGITSELVNVEGGLLAWDKAGYSTLSLTTRLSLMRQVLLVAGLLVVCGYALSLLIHPAFIYLSVFVGAGLSFAGLTGWCGMSMLLSKMPWNK